MKKAGNSWKMIAHEVGASKKDVTYRHKELSESINKSAEDGDTDHFGIGDLPGMFNDDDSTEKLTPQPQPAKKLNKVQKGEKEDKVENEEKREENKVIVDTAALEVEHGKKQLVPDAVWTVGDLEVLANVEQRYRKFKWMHVQAGFYNLTGRMIGSEVIKAKFERG
jgi:hypothetical protein